MGGGNIHLELFHLAAIEFNNPFALGTDHMVMVIPQMPVFIAKPAVIESILLCKSEATHDFQGFFDDIRLEEMSFILEQLSQFANCNMLFCQQERLKDRVSFLKSIEQVVPE